MWFIMATAAVVAFVDDAMPRSVPPSQQPSIQTPLVENSGKSLFGCCSLSECVNNKPSKNGETSIEMAAVSVIHPRAHRKERTRERGF